MKATELLGRMTKRVINIPTWVGFKQLSDTTKELGGFIKETFTIPEAKPETETFEQALVRLKLTEQDVKQRIKIFTYLCIFWLIATVCVLAYGIYLAEVGTWYSFVACVCISLVCLTQAFRYNFWLFQMKQRHLGCTIRDWLNGSILGDKK